MARLLLVEDDINFAKTCKIQLEDEGYEVEVCHTGEEAVELIPKEKFDLVILDIRMPGISGIDALEKIVKKDRSLPAIIYTAYPIYKENFLTWLADEYVVKSSDFSELKEKIHSILAKKRKKEDSKG